MKRMIICSITLLLFSCSEKKTLSPSQTAEIVVESFYHGEKDKLEEYTTDEGYAYLSSIQALFTVDKSSAVNFKVIQEVMDGDEVWIQYATGYDPTPGVFKLVKEDGQWKVAHNGPRAKGPF
ncbi:hypothetical protein [uncultured Salegentibacter sp.]|uniref:hypothetical protein n=1 Tax=uncultured Salegentibacter sp. TaxID=259320 RepID=UPI0030D9461B